MMNKTNPLKGYKINFSRNTVTMNYKFAAAASIYGSPEYCLLRSIKADFPNMVEVIQPGRKITTPRPTKRLTYENMKSYMSAYENRDELLAAFEKVRRLSKPMKSPYQYVRQWFTAQFPNYTEHPATVTGKFVAVIAPPPTVAGLPKEDEKTAA